MVALCSGWNIAEGKLDSGIRLALHICKWQISKAKSRLLSDISLPSPVMRRKAHTNANASSSTDEAQLPRPDVASRLQSIQVHATCQPVGIELHVVVSRLFGIGYQGFNFTTENVDNHQFHG